MKKTLPFSRPLVNHIPSDAVRLSILAAHKYYLPVVHNFCNLFAFEIATNQGQKILDTQFYWDIPEISRKLVPKALIKEILPFIMDAIDHGYYINVCIDSCKLPAYSNYNESNVFPHQMAVYGFDTVERILYCADFFSTGGFKTASIPFEVFLKSYESLQLESLALNPLTGATDWVTDVELLKPLLQYDQPLNLDLVHHNILNFINGANPYGYSSYTRKRPHLMTNTKAGSSGWLYEADVVSEVYGINVFKQIHSYFISVRKDKTYKFHYKMIYLFYAFHYLMFFRLSYIAGHYDRPCPNLKHLMDLCKQIVADARLLLNLFIKFTMTESDNLWTQVEERLCENIRATIGLLQNILNTI